VDGSRYVAGAYGAAVTVLTGPLASGSKAHEAQGEIGTDDAEIGRLAANAMASAGGPAGRVCVITGSLPGTGDSADAFRAAFKGSVGLAPTVDGTNTHERAKSAAAKLLASYPDLTGIFCTDDVVALGAADAVDAAGKHGRVRVIGVGGWSAARGAVDRGSMYATIVPQSELAGKYAVRIAVGLLDGIVKPPCRIAIPASVYKKR
jgi:ABC-type sugar transport system substrate-binding protein